MSKVIVDPEPFPQSKIKWLHGEQHDGVCMFCDEAETPENKLVLVIRKGKVAACFHENCLIELARLCIAT